MTPKTSVPHQSSRRSQTTADWVASFRRYGPVPTGGLFLKVEGILALPDVLGQDRDAAPDADRREGFAVEVEARIRRRQVEGDGEGSSTFSTDVTAALASVAQAIVGFSRSMS